MTLVGNLIVEKDFRYVSRNPIDARVASSAVEDKAKVGLKLRPDEASLSSSNNRHGAHAGLDQNTMQEHVEKVVSPGTLLPLSATSR